MIKRIIKISLPFLLVTLLLGISACGKSSAASVAGVSSVTENFGAYTDGTNLSETDDWEQLPDSL